MLDQEAYDRIAALIDDGSSDAALDSAARAIRERLNPHPSGQREHSVQMLGGERLSGFQPKYRDTVLFFAARCQTCHAFCTYCFRWAQSVGETENTFAAKETALLNGYLRRHPEVSDLLITGGDPMIMSSSRMAALIKPVLTSDLPGLRSIRIATRAMTFRPQRFATDADSDALLQLVERLAKSGRNLTVTAHVNHWREPDHSLAQSAVRRLLDAGATIHSQATLQARDAAAARQPFWATGPSDACWFDALTPEEGGATHHA